MLCVSCFPSVLCRCVEVWFIFDLTATSYFYAESRTFWSYLRALKIQYATYWKQEMWQTNKPISKLWIWVVLTKERLYLVCRRGDKESWIRSKYVEKKFIHKLPESGRNTLLRRSSARRNRTTTQDRSTQQRPPLKPKPNRATLPRLTGRRDRETHSVWWLIAPDWGKGKRKERVTVFLSMTGLSPSDIQKNNASYQRGKRKHLQLSELYIFL